MGRRQPPTSGDGHSMTASEDAWREAARLPLVPWVGAGVSTGIRHARTRAPLMPDWATFVRDAVQLLSAEERSRARDALDAGLLEEAATALRDGMVRAKWLGLLRDRFEATSADMHAESIDVLRAIWGVSKGLVITTNYDGTLSWVRSAADVQPIVYGLHAPPDLSSLLGSTQERPVLWHLHGSIQHPDTIVLERSEYERLYGAFGPAAELEHSASVPARGRNLDAAYLCLQTLVATQNLLFIGTSLTDPRVNRVLARVDGLFPVARTRHFMICLETELDSVQRRLHDNGLDDCITPLPLGSYSRDLLGRLRMLTEGVDAVAALDLREPKWIRRRCRAVVAGGEEFIAHLTPLIGEATQHEALAQLREMLEERDDLTQFQRTVVQALRYEFDAKVDQMVSRVGAALANPQQLTEEERLNLLLLHALGLEKLNRQEDVQQAMALLEEVIASPDTPAELRLCAEFNRDVCREKLGDPTVSFARYIDDMEFRFSTDELLWPKAWNMELVRCGRQSVPFAFSELFEDVIAAEINEFSTGVGKSIANWGHFAGRAEIDASLVERLNEIARAQTPANRVNFLIALASQTNDSHFREAIDNALVEAGENATVRRQLQTRPVHGRYTLYGEFLMHGRASGYVAPTPMHLRGSGDSTTVSGIWDQASDDVAGLVRRLGLKPMQAVSGDLPFGQGFASSTVLALLHIGDQLPPVERRRVVNVLDWLSHGFEPSGLDHDAVAAQGPGFYRHQEWRAAPPLALDGLFLRSTPIREISLAETRMRIDRAADRLAPLADEMTSVITERQELDADAYSAYCRELVRAGVYTKEQKSRVAEAASRGLSAKAIGGLHAKAVLVIGEPDRLDEYAAWLPGGVILGRLAPHEVDR